MRQFSKFPHILIDSYFQGTKQHFTHFIPFSLKQPTPSSQLQVK